MTLTYVCKFNNLMMSPLTIRPTILNDKKPEREGEERKHQQGGSSDLFSEEMFSADVSTLSHNG